MDTVSEKGNTVHRWLGYSLDGTCLIMILYHFYYIMVLPYETSIHAIIHLWFAAAVLIIRRIQESLRFRIFYVIMLAGALWATIYFLSHYDIILDDPSYPPLLALIAGTIATIIVFILTYQAIGWVFPAITAISVLYMAYGTYLPTSIRAPSVDLERLIALLSADVTSPWGVYGALLILSANYLFLFIFFGTTLEAFGGMRFILSFGRVVAARFKSGPAALSIFTSALLGSVTGSTVANITITGSFTIPLMKKNGYTHEMAAAIETAASSGGQILPPIMGATAFVMAGYTGIPYLSIAKACLIPAVLYFAVLLFYAEINARKLAIKAMPPVKMDVKKMMLDAPVFLAPLILMMVLLLHGFSLMRTIFWCLMCVGGLGLLNSIRKDARLDWKNVKNRIVDGILSGSQLAAMLALIGVIVGVVEVTGLGMRLGNILVALSHQNLFILLLMTAACAMILGMGVPSTAAYILCATVLSPALIKLGVPLMQAHLFPLYFAVFSHLTPPVGIGLIVACKMAEANYVRGAIEAAKAVLVTFLLPFFFVYTPAILIKFDSVSSCIHQILAVILSFFATSMLLNAYLATKLNVTERALLLIALSLLLLFIFIAQNYLFIIASGIFIVIATLFNIHNYKKL